MKNVVRIIGCVVVIIVLTIGSAQSAIMNDYCITPAFITAGVKPNLLLLIDNSASMYDLAYQDTTNLYCANAPTTACTTNANCAGSGTCVTSVTTTAGTSSTTAKTCTGTDVARTQCPNSPQSTTTSAKSCNTDSDCPGFSNDCNTGKNLCKNATTSTTTYPCNSGFCNTCNTTTGVGDCVTTTTAATYTPIGCNNDATCSGYTSGDTCNNKCTSTRQCYDTSYSSATTYTGYFDSSATYSYDSTNVLFTSGATMPGSCTYSSGSPSYFCVTTSTTPPGFVASGNFLNWLTTSKFDVEKKILTGGKYNTVSSALIGESRGCAGRKYIKSVPGVSLTFAIRGGTAGGLSSTQSQATEYGQTYIELYTGTYNAADCLSAMNDWMTVSTSPVNLGTFQNDTKGCVGAGNGAYNAVNIWNHILHNCYDGILNKAQGYGTNMNSLQGECKSAYASVGSPAAITDPNTGISICSSALTYTDASGVAQTGYLGACYNSTTGLFDNTCSLTQMANYCRLNVSTAPVADPSSTSLSASSLSAPGFILEQGLMNTVLVGSYPVRVSATTPTGLINSNKYKDMIRFGAMTFQNNASGSECGTTSLPCSKTCSVSTTRICYFDSDCPTGETCGTLAKTDGGKIISYVGAGYCSTATSTACDVDSDCSSLTPSGQYCIPNVGDASSGLIKAINDIPATSWTPFAEAFYNAIGYYARTNAYTASPPTSRSDSYFNQLPSPNTALSYNSSKNPSQFICQANNILLITDGMSTADKNTASDGLASVYASRVPNTVSGTTTYGISGYDTTNSCPAYSGSRSISDLSWIAKNRNIKSLTTSSPVTTSPLAASESITSYIVYSGPQTSGFSGLCDPKTLMTNTASNGGTTLLSATTPTDLYDKIDAAFSSVAAKAASGTAASILSNSEGSGANILQAVFFPKKIFDSATYSTWIGEMLNLWYYVDPFISNSTIREDTNGDLKLNLLNDYVANFVFDSALDRTMVQLYNDTNGDGAGDTAVGGSIETDDVKAIWRAGRLLWSRDISTSPRMIYTPLITGGTQVGSTGLMNFTYGSIGSTAFANNSVTLQPYLQYSASNANAVKLMKWVHGFDFPGDATIRNRTVKSTVGGVSLPAATVSTDTSSLYVTNPSTKGIGVWKLGDIISSTPRLQSTVRLNTYDLVRPSGYEDKSYESYVNSNNYATRGMVYVGANDGMLHAFKLGVLSVKASGYQKASISGSNLGKEEWAFIPKNFLPYLKYLSDPAYNHLYAIDGRTVIFDASIGYTNSGTCVKSTYWKCDKPTSGTSSVVVDSSNNLNSAKNTWRTIVIGGMGLGGASRSSCTSDTSCVLTPITDPSDSSEHPASLGYSSYFALDVTDQDNPQFLWEFSNNQLGYATTGPAIIRVGSPDKNGRWFAVFGSGPFGNIDTSTHQFKGNSGHHLRFFVVDLRTGELKKTILTDVDNGFAGAMLGASIDADRRNTTTKTIDSKTYLGNYQDDAVYVGYTKQASSGSWTDGGVGRIMVAPLSTTAEPDDTYIGNTFNWSKVIDGIGPVTTSIAKLQDVQNKNLWLFFGTGRYFYRDSVSLDDPTSRRALYGIKEPCYSSTNTLSETPTAASCTTEQTGTIVNQTTSITTLATTAGGWTIDLDNATTAGVSGATTSQAAERVVTDTVALTNGSVFFTSFKPTLDICGYGGNSYLWGVKYNTGGQASTNALQGKALIQLSTGEFKEVELSNAFTTGTHLNRRMGTPMTGKPPSDLPPIVTNASNKPVKKILHLQEK